MYVYICINLKAYASAAGPYFFTQVATARRNLSAQAARSTEKEALAGPKGYQEGTSGIKRWPNGV